MSKIKRKPIKKPLIDVDTDANKKQSSRKSSNNKKESQTSPFSFDTEFDINVLDGINDLAQLPRDLIQSELKRRGYQPDMVDFLPTKILLNTLRSGKRIMNNTEPNEQFYNYPYYSEFRQVQGPIFDDTPEEILKKRNAEEKMRIEKEKEYEDEMMEKNCSLNPDEFRKEDYDDSTNRSNELNDNNNNTGTPAMNYFPPNFYPNQRHLNYSLHIDLINYGVDVDELISEQNDPNKILFDSIEKDASNHYSTEDIFFRNVILNSISTGDN